MLFDNVIIPMISNAMKEDSDGDGIIDNLDPYPFKAFDDRFQIINSYDIVPYLDFVITRKKRSDSCYNTRAQTITTLKTKIDLNLICTGCLSILPQIFLNDNVARMINASMFLAHYLEGTGETYFLNADEVYSAISTAERNRNHFRYNVDSLMKVVENTVMPNSELVISSKSNSEFRACCYAHAASLCKEAGVNHPPNSDNLNGKAFDWSNSIGESFGAMICKAENNNGIYTMTCRYYIQDYYEWACHYNPNDDSYSPSYYDGGDDEHHMLHECGLAREFPVTGFYEFTLTWKQYQKLFTYAVADLNTMYGIPFYNIK